MDKLTEIRKGHTKLINQETFNLEALKSIMREDERNVLARQELVREFQSDNKVLKFVGTASDILIEWLMVSLVVGGLLAVWLL